MGRVQHKRQDVDLTAIEHALGAAWLRSALDSTTGYVSVFRPDGTLEFVSPSVREVLGYSPEDLVGSRRPDILHPDDRERTRKVIGDLLAEPSRVGTVNARCRHRDGGWRWLESHIVNLTDHPTVHAVVASAYDVTGRREEREHAEAARRASEARFRALAEHSSDILTVHGADGRLTYMSPSAERFFGLTLDEAVGRRSLHNFVHPEDRDFHELTSLRDLRGTTGPRLVRVRNHRGDWRWLEAITTNLLDDKNVQGFVTNGRDVTERVETTQGLVAAEEALRRSEERFRAIAQHASNIVVILDDAGKVLYSSPSATRIMGYAAEDWVRREAFDLVHPDDLDDALRLFARALAEPGPTRPAWVRVQHADGTWRWLESIAQNLIDEPAVGGIVVHARDVTVQHEAATALRQSERRYRGIVEDQTELICRYQSDSTISFVNEACARYFDKSVDELIGRQWVDLLADADRAEALAMIRSLTPENPAVAYEHRVVAPDGEVRWQQWSNRVVLNDQGGVAEYQSVGRDITDQRLAEDAAQASQRLVADQARVLEAIATGAALDEIVDDLCHVVERHVPGVHCSIQLFDENGRSIHHGSVTSQSERCWVTPIVSSGDGRKLGTFSVSYDEPQQPEADHKEVVELVHDLAAIAIERKKYEAKLAHQAHHDPLTGLPNRTLFLEFLQLAMARARRYRSTVGVLFLDLDRFKVVNDSLGHDAGDELLVALGQRLRGVVRPGDTVARFGGDEFTVLCEDLPTASAGDHATDVAERMLHVIEQPFLLDGEEQYLSASIGIALAGPGTERPEGLLRDADAAMYRAKDRGKGRWELFDEVMRATALERLETENALHRALERGELRVHYQPVISLRDQRCIGAEALVRWAHPERGLLTPDQFIDLAEESGLIVPIGRWVIEDACRRSRVWRAEHGPAFAVSVNLSGRQLSNPEMAEQVTAALGHTGADPAALCFEITENVLMDDVDATISAIAALKSLGVTLSIDDFGTGYSSLGYLKRFPVDSVKVDQSFIHGLGADPEDTAIVAAVVSLGHALDLTVIAEGVETDRQLAELVALGCDAAQGYLFARPAPGNNLVKRIDPSRLAAATEALPTGAAPVD
jgi:diguanylate cyclase (GGDEF)-like protein/PAS domain S-box-containing protein